jgi:hypothetical protein
MPSEEGVCCVLSSKWAAFWCCLFSSSRPHSHLLYLETKNVCDGPRAAAPELSLKSFIPCRPPNHTPWLSHYQHTTYNSDIKYAFSAGLSDHLVQGVVPSEYSGSRSKSESLPQSLCGLHPHASRFYTRSATSPELPGNKIVQVLDVRGSWTVTKCCLQFKNAEQRLR